MKATLLLADYAQVSDGKVTMNGSGWSQIRVAGPFGFFVAGMLQVPWDRAAGQHELLIELLDADGNAIPSNIPDANVKIVMTFEMDGELPADMKPRTPLDVPVAAPFGPLDLEPGRYEVRYSVDGDVHEDWHLAFTVSQQSLAA